MTVVSNSTPLIHLSAVGDLELLPQLFGSILIPPSVYREVVLEGGGLPGEAEVRAAMGTWLGIGELLNQEAVTELMHSEDLHPGETEAIVLAQQIQAQAILLDDQLAVVAARARGLDVIRTPALYVAAKRNGKIEHVRPKLEHLRRTGFRLKDSDYEAILRFAGE